MEKLRVKWKASHYYLQKAKHNFKKLYSLYLFSTPHFLWEWNLACGNITIRLCFWKQRHKTSLYVTRTHLYKSLNLCISIYVVVYIYVSWLTSVWKYNKQKCFLLQIFLKSLCSWSLSWEWWCCFKLLSQLSHVEATLLMKLNGE